MAPEEQLKAIVKVCNLNFQRIDLNAMHEAEKSTEMYSYPQRERYYGHLMDIIHAEGIERPFMSATAAQRAEAFLRTLGLWK